MPKILLPIDVQHPHDEFIEQLDKLIDLKASQLHLLYVKDELPGYEAILGTVADFPDDLKHQIETKIADLFADMKSKLEAKGAKAVTSSVLGGLAAMTIDQVARDDGYDMIAMSAGTHTRVQQFLIGSTTSRVVNHAPCTVLVMKNVSTTPMKNIVVAIDGSEAALKAAVKAVKLFGLSQRDVQVTCINVVSVKGLYKFISPVQFIAAIEDNLVMSGEASLAAAEKELSELGMTKLDNVLKNGEPADEIINFADSIKADLIILGAQGRSAVEKFLVGTVSDRVSTFAKCSTAVIK
ncbi:MAG: universal stress protein [Cyanobacteria bacterium SZAS-4]|nr:universal stress protein [Cyanobacteria bacterium SZAS-4]